MRDRQSACGKMQFRMNRWPIGILYDIRCSERDGCWPRCRRRVGHFCWPIEIPQKAYTCTQAIGERQLWLAVGFEIEFTDEINQDRQATGDRFARAQMRAHTVWKIRIQNAGAGSRRFGKRARKWN